MPPNKLCSKCKAIDQHVTLSCKIPWPLHEEQICDYCGKSDHEASDCKDKDQKPVCTKCGHAGHKTAKCPLSDSRKEDQLRQYTRKMYWRIKDPEMLKSLSLDDAPSQKTTSSDSRPPIKKYEGKLEKPKLTEKQKQYAHWAEQALKLAKFEPADGVTKPLLVRTNFFEVQLGKNIELRRYRIQLGKINEKEVTKREVKRALIEDLLHAQQPPDSTVWASDYFSHIVSVGKLYSQDSNEPGSVVQLTHRRPAPPDANGNARTVLMDSFIEFERFLDKGQLAALIDRTKVCKPGYLPDEDLKILNVACWKPISRGFAGGLVGKKFYPDPILSPEEQDKESHSLYLIRKGFFTSIRPGDGRLLLNVNRTASAFYPDYNVLGHNVENWIQRRKALPKPFGREMKGLRVIFYSKKNENPTANKMLIFEVRADVSSVTFKDENGNEKKVYDHMIQTYGQGFCDKTTHAVNVGNAKIQRWYFANRLKFVPWQVVRSTLEGSLTKDMIDIAKKTPAETMSDIQDQALVHLGIRQLGNAPQARLNYKSPFNFEISRDFLTIKARSLKAPNLEVGNKATITPFQAGWNFKAQKFSSPKAYPNMSVIAVGSMQKSGLDDFAKKLRNQLMASGLGTGEFQTVVARNVPSPSLKFHARREQLNRALNEAYEEISGNISLIVLVLVDQAGEVKQNTKPNQRKQDGRSKLYPDVKWWADCVKGVPNVCVTQGSGYRKTIKDDGMCKGNICLKINFKLQGASHVLKEPGGYGAKANTMVVGADVSHPPKGDQNAPSMAGIVATCTDRFNHYLASARLQRNNTEYIEQLDDMIYERLFAYGNENKRFPDHILFYRDGVSESQYGMVKEKELQLIKDGIERAKKDKNQPTKKIEITLIVVGKRHHTRFFPTSGNAKANTPGVLVVDTDVVDPKRFNFYLQSHDSPIGTARSAHYVVITNESGYKAQELQLLTQRICYLGARATKALSTCTPARYADILCNRLRCYMKPVLDGDFESAGLQHVSDYARNKDIWAVPNPRDSQMRRSNPWHPNVNNIMFYL